MAHAIQAAIDPLPVMRRVVEQAVVLIAAADGAAVRVADGDGITHTCGSGVNADHIDEPSPRDRRARARCRPATRDVLCTPLTHHGKVFGTLEVSSEREAAFTVEDLRVLSSLSEFVASALGGTLDLARAVNDATAASPRLTDDTNETDPMARFVAAVLRPQAAADIATARRIGHTISNAAFDVVGQPITDLLSGETVAVEALARFPDAPQQGPEALFSEARRLGCGKALELAAVSRALELQQDLDDTVSLAINVSSEAITAPELPDLLTTGTPERIILELTEHLPVEDYPDVRRALDGIRGAGVRLAVDDTGSGFSGLQHIVNLAPDLIKLDRQITHAIDSDPARRYLTEALVDFARHTGAQVVAEGIETSDELDAVKALGIRYGQGFLIAPPAPLRRDCPATADASGESGHAAMPRPTGGRVRAARFERDDCLKPSLEMPILSA